MTIDRRTALSLSLVSLIFMLGSGILIWQRITKVSSAGTPAAPSLPGPVDPSLGVGTGWPHQPSPAAQPPVIPPPVVSAPPAPPVEVMPPAAPSRKRNIRFTYRNSRPLKVEIVGSFNNWTPAALVKGENHTWELSIPLEAGEHAYNFLVDGKPARDPNNPRTAPEGRSLLVIPAQ